MTKVTQGHSRLARWIAEQKQADSTLVVGINGAQGSGKSTLTQAMRDELSARHGLRVAALSLDDLYFTRAAREQLAKDVHPLLVTRGVPGTHDVALGLQVLEGLKALKPGSSLALPRFIKAADERAPDTAWPRIEGAVDVILFEGWCVGTPAQAEAELRRPINALEAQEDANGVWRRYANAQLAGEYARLFGLIDRLVFLKTPDFDSIFRWRLRQEAANAQQAGADASCVMGPDALRRFIQHYERLTRHALRVLPERADVVLELGQEHEIRNILL